LSWTTYLRIPSYKTLQPTYILWKKVLLWKTFEHGSNQKHPIERRESPSLLVFSMVRESSRTWAAIVQNTQAKVENNDPDGRLAQLSWRREEG
jgi:hypothetical protein